MHMLCYQTSALSWLVRNPAQHSLCRPARPQAAARRPAQLLMCRIAVQTITAQTVSWSFPIIINAFNYVISECTEMDVLCSVTKPMKATDSIQASLLKASIRFLYVGAKNSHISVVAAPFLNGNNKERTFTAKVVKRKSANHTRNTI